MSDSGSGETRSPFQGGSMKAGERYEAERAERLREREQAGELSDQNIFYVYGYMIGNLNGKLSDVGSKLSGADLGKLEAEAIRAFEREREAEREARIRKLGGAFTIEYFDANGKRGSLVTNEADHIAERIERRAGRVIAIRDNGEA